MLGTAIFVGSLLALNVLLIFTCPYRDQFLTKLALTIPLTVGIFLVGFLTTRLLSRLGRAGGASFMTAPIYSARVLIVLSTTAAFEVVVPRALGSVWSTEVAYYLALAICGVALALWCRASSYVPILVAALTLLIVSAVAATLFLRDPGVDFQYGPEKYLFALWNYAGGVNMLPLDGIVTWFAWRVAGQVSMSAA